MPQSATDVANLAISLIGDDTQLTDVTSDTTKVGKQCRLHLENTRQALLRSFIWNFAKDRTTLTLLTISGAADNGSGLIRITTSATHGFSSGNRVTISDVQGTSEANGQWTITVINTTTFDLQGSTFTNTYVSGGYVSLVPTFYWSFKHAIPSTCLRVIRAFDDPDYEIESGFILTNETSIDITYINDVTDYTKMDSLFYNAFALALAIKICYAMTQSKTLKEQLQEEFKTTMQKARFTDSVEEPTKLIQADDWELARLGGGNNGFVRDPMTS